MPFGAIYGGIKLIERAYEQKLQETNPINPQILLLKEAPEELPIEASCLNKKAPEASQLVPEVAPIEVEIKVITPIPVAKVESNLATKVKEFAKSIFNHMVALFSLYFQSIVGRCQHFYQRDHREHREEMRKSPL